MPNIGMQMQEKSRKVVLFMENRPAHPENIQGLNYAHVEFLSADYRCTLEDEKLKPENKAPKTTIPSSTILREII